MLIFPESAEKRRLGLFGNQKGLIWREAKTRSRAVDRGRRGGWRWDFGGFCGFFYYFLRTGRCFGGTEPEPRERMDDVGGERSDGSPPPVTISDTCSAPVKSRNSPTPADAILLQ